MRRRIFIKFTVLSLFFLKKDIVIAKTISPNTLMILNEVYDILFPKTLNMPSAEDSKILNYLLKNINHRSFDDEDKTLILQGTYDFTNSFPLFMNLKKKEKKDLIYSIIEDNEYAKSWISKLTYYGIEAMFSDPLYGGNFQEITWSSVGHSVGYPRPKKVYGQKYDI